jgi:hypothetical protein
MVFLRKKSLMEECKESSLFIEVFSLEFKSTEFFQYLRSFIILW